MNSTITCNKILTLLFLFSCSLISAQTIYVKADAGGNNDGTSWVDAYTDLGVAIDSAVAGTEIWVAAGTYQPGGMTPDTTSFFSMKDEVKFYGGFAGTETMLSERDPSVSISIISGDLAGDDIAGNTVDNRTDNCKHLFWAVDSIDNSTVLDGFTLQGGHAYNSAEGGDTRRGGAILAYGAPTIRNCIFRDNHGHFGGAVYPRFSGASGIIIDKCEFIGNSGGAGGAMYINSISGGEITDCIFSRNSSSGTAGAVYNQNSTNIYRNCLFEENQSNNNSRGGAIYNTNSGMSLLECEFINNISPRTGGGIHNRSDDSITVVIQDCNFSGNQARWGGAITNYDSTTQVIIQKCLFTGNKVSVSGGAISSGFKAQTVIEDSEFTNNLAEDALAMVGTGGALFNQNDSTSLIVSNCTFDNNSSFANGGAFNSSENTPTSFTNCTFSSNRSITGGAISYSPDTAEIFSIALNSCIFSFNVAQNQGGALNFGNATASLINCLIETNVASGSGTGGAISNNASINQRSTISIMNSTIAQNIGILSAGIAQWEEDTTARATITLQNTILFNPDGLNYAIEDGTPEIFSNGGNLSGASDLSAVLTNTNDTLSADPNFIDVYSSDFHIPANSPCVDRGITTGAPLVDIEGLPRFGQPDIGAYEYIVLKVEEVVDEQVLSLFPNPADRVIWLELDNEWKGLLRINIFNSAGQVVVNRLVAKDFQKFRLEGDIENLSAGVYRLSVSNGKQLVSRAFIKS